MTLMKSLLLGSAAGIVGIASAQAADLPTRKGAPAVEYVKICSITVNGKPVVGWTLPGSDTCFKLSGYVTGQVEGGNTKTTETTNYSPLAQSATGPSTISNLPNPYHGTTLWPHSPLDGPFGPDGATRYNNNLARAQDDP